MVKKRKEVSEEQIYFEDETWANQNCRPKKGWRDVWAEKNIYEAKRKRENSTVHYVHTVCPIKKDNRAFWA